ncbi:hypothetical protein K402DRAFT_409341 [Aulographum hederae CBS 113979]|uniref:PWWP domain-containing protein n=1 Tax=Aulographum hederae CBS 113979 TaxID=1176131 RepID=A0A6G1HHR4_9PEZI|nr:hypothetical protein K402DRAFT_409341 [Aulographum hederae CBS 113979]
MADETAQQPASSPPADTPAPVPEVDNAAQPAPAEAVATDLTSQPAPAEEAADYTTKLAAPAAPAAPAATAATGSSTPDTSKKPNKRKSGGVPEHKGKNLKKRKSVLDLHLDVQPGEYWMVRMKGHPPWPAIICDEPMLPESLLIKRPVSAAHPDGSYRQDFLEGGKNARDRRYPVMFLGTNEFAWQVNTDISPIDMDEIKEAIEAGEGNWKKTKALFNAYEVAAEEHPLQYFKDMLLQHEQAMQDDAEEAANKALEKEKKAEKAAKRKSKENVEADEDIEMGDADAESTKKPKNKKRKKVAEESDGETEKPVAKTPKLKVNGPKVPTEESATKPKKAAKPKKKAVAPKEDPESEASNEVSQENGAAIISPEEQHEKLKKAVLYLRHKLQKGFLSRDVVPKEEEMKAMADHLTSLESYRDLDATTIKETKINKVLKGILKLDSIPKDELFNFKSRSTELLNGWTKALVSDSGANGHETTVEPAGEATATPNGVANGDESPDKPSAAPEPKEEFVPAIEKSEEPAEEADTTMVDADAKDEPKVDEAEKTEPEETEPASEPAKEDVPVPTSE